MPGIFQMVCRYLLIAILFLFLPVSAEAATYYLRADGTAANKEAASGPGATQANCMNISVHNGETFSADDVIAVCDDGGDFRSKLIIPTSSVTYQPETGDTPIFRATDSIATGSWTEVDETYNIWRNTTSGLGSSYDYFYGMLDDDGDTREKHYQSKPAYSAWTNLYFFGRDGDGYFYYKNDAWSSNGSPTEAREVGVRDYCVDLNEKDNITLSGLHFYGPEGINGETVNTNNRGLVRNDGSNNTITGCHFYYSSGNAMIAVAGADNSAVTSCYADGNYGAIFFADPGNTHTVTACHVTNSGTIIGDAPAGDKSCIAGAGFDNFTVQDCYLDTQGNSAQTDSDSMITLASVGGTINILRNYMKNGAHSGVSVGGIPAGTNVNIVGNIVDNCDQISGNDYYEGIRVGISSTGVAGDLNVHNNLIINMTETSAVTDSCAMKIKHDWTNIYLRNNLFYNNTGLDFEVNWYPTATGTRAVTGNDFYRTSGNIFKKAGTPYAYTALTTFESETAYASDNMVADPVLVDDSGSGLDFALQESSPCIDAGYNNGTSTTLNTAIHTDDKTFTTTLNAATTTQTNWGDSPYYEIGPFPYTGGEEPPPGGECSGDFSDGDNESFEKGAGEFCTTEWTETDVSNVIDLYNATVANTGSYSCQIKLDSDTATQGLISANLGSTTTEKYFRWYFQTDSNWAGGIYRLPCIGASTGVADRTISILASDTVAADVKIYLYNGTNSTHYFYLDKDKWYRFEIHAKQNDTCTLKIWDVSGDDWLDADDSSQSITLAGNDKAIQYLWFDDTYDDSTDIKAYIDDVQSGDDWLGTVGEGASPSITDVVLINDIDGTPSVTENPTQTWSTAGETKWIGLKLSEELKIVNNPNAAYVPVLCGPIATDTVNIYVDRQIQIDGDWYLALPFTVLAGYASSDLGFSGIDQFVVNTATLQDGDENNLDMTLTRADIGGTGTITVACPSTTAAPTLISSSRKFSDMLQVADGFYKYTEAVTDNVEITANNVTIYYPGHSIANTGNLTFSGESGYIRGVLFSGAVTGAGANGNVYHPTNPRRKNRMGMNP